MGFITIKPPCGRVSFYDIFPTPLSHKQMKAKKANLTLGEMTSVSVRDGSMSYNTSTSLLLRARWWSPLGILFWHRLSEVSPTVKMIRFFPISWSNLQAKNPTLYWFNWIESWWAFIFAILDDHFFSGKNFRAFRVATVGEGDSHLPVI